jgi:hypothetical protein
MEQQGHRVLSAAVQEWSLGRYTGGALSSAQPEPAQAPAAHAAMAASAASSGKTLRQLAREGGGAARPVGVSSTVDHTGSTGGGPTGSTSGTSLTSTAAVQGPVSQQQQQQQGVQLGVRPSQGLGVAAPSTPDASNLSRRGPGTAGSQGAPVTIDQGAPSSSGTQGTTLRGTDGSSPSESGSPGQGAEGGDVAVMYEHVDAETERLERLQRQLEGDG